MAKHKPPYTFLGNFHQEFHMYKSGKNYLDGAAYQYKVFEIN